KLSDGWKLRWRARATAAGITGAWSPWSTFTVDVASGAQKASSKAASTEPPAFKLNHLTLEECEGDRLPDGRYKWRDVALAFSWCFTHWYGVSLYKRAWVDGKWVKLYVGWVQFRGSTVINTRIGRQNNDAAYDDPNRKSRDIDVWFKINHLRYTGDTTQVSLRTYVKKAGDPTTSQCMPTSSTGRQSSLPEWESNKSSLITFRSHPGALGPDYVGTCTISPYIEVGSQIGDEDFPHFSTAPVVACDTASDNPNAVGGCVFETANKIMVYDTTSAAHSPVARHIKDAFYNPGPTAPSNSNKAVPGNFMAPRASAQGKPLHRTIDPRLRRDTRDRVVTVCATLPIIVDTECDEYPFNSSYEGGGRVWKTAALTDNYSVRRVFASQNGSAGTTLNWFYWRYRILDNDPFWVMITTDNVPQ
ncbi:hypothetical protein ACIBEJ_33855, partial [Nonomuraea sp. NPDC050790]|uniref:NucA/NucB deoxyribonuclease domain-containing protein n=1 Tax=Nonomuraea sp. NPDC050790 TaxID=3364371 RepID=UPI0037AC117C